MSLRITGPAAGQFEHPFGLPDDELARRNARRCIADQPAGFPDRIELRHAAAGRSLLERLPADPQMVDVHAHYARRGCHACRIDRAVESRAR